MIRTAAAAFAIAGLLAATAAPAFAETGVANTQILRVTPAALRSPAAQANLRHRVHLAAVAVCGPAEPFNSPDFASYEQCMTTAEHNALQRVDALVAKTATTGEFASN